MSRIFLSHSSKDDFEAIAVRDWLASEGWDDVFLDLDPDRGIAAGERWERALHAAATRCEAVIFLVSANWLASGWCMKEYALARGLNKQLFAVIVDRGLTVVGLPPELNGTWQVVDLTGGQDLQIVPILLPGSHEEKHVAFAREGLRRLKRGLEKAGLDAKFFAWPPPAEPERAPYRGLKPLDGVDAGIFFGRDAPIVEGVDQLRGLHAGAAPRLMVILGASGAGKSSFLRAGLLPRLARDDSHFLPLPVIRPERAVLFGETGLLGALEAAMPNRVRADIRAAIQAGAAGVRPLLAEIADAGLRRTLESDEAGKPPAIVIAIDQAEELFRAEGGAEGTAFLGIIRDLTAEDRPGVIAVFAIRSDSYDALEHAKPLEGLQQHTLPLLPMPRGAYKDVIEGPARRFVEAGGKLAIEPQLTQRLLEDLDKGGGSDALPLLAFTLEQLFLEYRRAGALRLANYEAFRGIRGAIDAAVERAFVRADSDGRIPRERAAREALLRRGLIPWLAGVDPDTKSLRRNIARRADIPVEAAPLIDLLVEERLLATDMQALGDVGPGAETRIVTIEPAHEALLRQWGLLEGWLAEDFGLLATLEAVKRAARDWDASGRADAWLAHHGLRLAEAQALDERPDIAARLDAIDRAYLAGCRAKEATAQAEAETRQRERQEEQARRLADAEALAAANRLTARRTGIGLVAALVLAAAAGGFGLYALSQKKVAEQKTEEAQTQSARAERALTAATKAANTLVFGLAEKFRGVVGVPAALIKTILDPALKMQDDLIGAGETDPDLRQSQSDALLEAALMFLSLGDSNDALAAVLKSHAIMVDLVALQPENRARKYFLSTALIAVAEVRLQTGDQAAALAAAEEALAISTVIAADKGYRDGQLALYAGLNDVGDMKAKAGDQAGALISYEKALAVARDLATDKTDRQTQRQVLLTLFRIGNTKVLIGDRAGALAAYGEELTIARDLAVDKTDTAALFQLAATLQAIGDLKLPAGDRAGALAAYEEGLVLDRELAKDKSNIQAQRALSLALQKVGDVKRESGDLAGALAAFQESLDLTRAGAKDAGSAQAQRDLSIALDRIGDIQLGKGDQAGALASFQESLAIARTLAKETSNAQAQRDLSISLSKLGDAMLSGNDIAGALAVYEESLAVCRALAKDATNVQAQRDLLVSLNEVGDVKLRQNDPASALAAYEESLGLARTLAKDASNAEAQHDLLVTLEKLGDAKVKKSDSAGALAVYEEGVILARVLAKEAGNAQAQRGLWLALSEVGDVKLQSDDQAGALAAYEESLTVARALAKVSSSTPDQLNVVLSLVRVGQASGDSGPFYREAIAMLKDLDAQGRLNKQQIDFMETLEKSMADAPGEKR